MNQLHLKYVFLSALLISVLATGCVQNQKDSEGGDTPPKDTPAQVDPLEGTDPGGKDPQPNGGSETTPPVQPHTQPPTETEEARTARSAIAKLGGGEDDVVVGTRVLESMGPSATQYLVLALKDPSAEVRQRVAFMLLARFNPADPQMTKAMLETLGDKSAEVRRMALRAVDQIEDPALAAPGVKHLVKILEEDKKAHVRAHAARILGRLGEHAKPGFSVLQEAMLADQSAAVRFAAFKAICEVGAGDAQTAQALVAVLKESQDDNLRRQVVLRIADYGPAASSAVTPLVAMLGVSDERLRNAASDALARLGKPAVTELVKALDAKQTVDRAMAAITLGKIGADASDAIKPLQETLKDDQEAVRQAAQVALRKISVSP